MRKFSFYVIITIIFIPVLIVSNSSVAKGEEGTNYHDNMEYHLDFLIDEELAGRKVGTEGNETTVKYLEDKFKEYGLKSPEDLGYPRFEGYQHEINTPLVRWGGEPTFEIELEDETKELDYRTDYRPRKDDYSAGGNYQGEFKHLEEYQQMFEIRDDLEGSAVLVDYYGSDFEERGYDEYEMDKWLVHQGAEVVIYPEEEDMISERNLEIGEKKTFIHSRGIIKIGVTPKLFQELVEGQDESFLNVEIPLEIDEEAAASNVMGVMPGKDELLDGYIMLAVSLDGYGRDGEGNYDPAVSESVIPQAIMLETIRELTESDFKPDKTVVFAAFNAEQLGNMGSREYLDDSPFPGELKEVIYLENIFYGENSEKQLHVNTFESPRAERMPSARLMRKMADVGDDFNIDVEKDHQTMVGSHHVFRHSGMIAVSLSGELSDPNLETDKDGLEIRHGDLELEHDELNTLVEYNKAALETITEQDVLKEIRGGASIALIPLAGLAIAVPVTRGKNAKKSVLITLAVVTVFIFATALHSMHYQLDNTWQLPEEISLDPFILLNGLALAIPSVMAMFFWTWLYYIPSVIAAAISNWYITRFQIIITSAVLYFCNVHLLINNYSHYYNALYPNFLQFSYVEYVLPLIVLGISLLIFTLIKKVTDLDGLPLLMLLILINYVLLIYLIAPHFMSQEVIELRRNNQTITY
ncbi:M28 family metallopeptidase [Natranaerobius thermophilus]|uniref:Peptidase M28 domain-containing protein n=1 Tax=Natranaerobius thermophilus (strain ATCC BAA-1301 / DSM 18059 / JW/NM-WN-LF) TaxID=457570 RepID=B2A7N2_NATTJ|nr:M28 family peptidase [Natranaerobius thermophilus]ACB85743.1 hypothetical protein Nther_2177 [Natranaerobius thermophilus JW/NM-WN-LF]